MHPLVTLEEAGRALLQKWTQMASKHLTQQWSVVGRVIILSVLVRVSIAVLKYSLGRKGFPSVYSPQVKFCR